MKSDKHGNPIFEEADLFELLYQDQDISSFKEKIYTEGLEEFSKNSGIIFRNNTTNTLTTEEFDLDNQKNWSMPEDYKKLDIEGYLVNVCPKEHYERLIQELREFRARNMLDLLKWLKYFVDTARKENIVWGVGRGSSVSSYVLFLIGVHKIDSIKYKLDFKEFMR